MLSQKKKVSSGAEALRTFVVAFFLFLAIRAFLLQSFFIPSGSMLPNLLIGDYIFVSKWSYGYGRYSFPWVSFSFDGRIASSVPERGDVVVFRLPTNTTEDYIKRVVGLPGDRIQMRKGTLYLNREMVPRRRIEDYLVGNGPKSDVGLRIPRYIETLPNGRSYEILEADGDGGALDNTPEYLLPDGHYFFMGDNRDRSQDSRILWVVGFVPEGNLLGPARVKFYSFDANEGSWKKPWTWPAAVRFEEIFKGFD